MSKDGSGGGEGGYSGSGVSGGSGPMADIDRARLQDDPFTQLAQLRDKFDDQQAVNKQLVQKSAELAIENSRLKTTKVELMAKIEVYQDVIERLVEKMI